jgi:multidrug efflux system membrane fusion protein
LQKALAAWARARGQAERLKPLVAADAISRQSYDDAVAARAQALADVAEARASLRRRQLDLAFSRVTAPIAGRIGAANVTEGALVTAGDANPLASVQQIDRVYVDVRQPADHFARLRASGQASGPVEIVTAGDRSTRSEGMSCSRALRSIRAPGTCWCASRSTIRASACCRACMFAPACRARFP